MTQHPKLWLALGSMAVTVGAAIVCGTSSTGGGLPGANGSGTGAGQGPGTSLNGGSGQNGAIAGNGGGDSTGSGNAGGSTGASGGAGATGGSATGGMSGGKGTGASTGSGGGTGAADAGPPPTPHMGNTCLKPGGGDYTKAGPYTVMMQTGVDLGASEMLPDAGPTTYTIFYPQPFEQSCKHPVVAWGNGTGVTGYQVYQFFNNNAASWGMVVIASDNSNVGSGQYHKAAIDYMMKQNADPKSMFYQKLSTRVGTSGHSQGGIGATQGAGLIGSACEAEVCVAGGGLPAKTNAFICLTGSADLAEQGCTS